MTSFPVNPGVALGAVVDPAFATRLVGWGVYKQIITLGDVEYSNILSQFARAPERLRWWFEEISFMVEMHEKYRASRGGKKTRCEKKTSKQRGCKIPPLTVDQQAKRLQDSPIDSWFLKVSSDFLRRSLELLYYPYPRYKKLAPPGGLARAGTRSTVTTCDEYPQPFVVLVVMVLILLCFFHIKCVFSEVDCISCFQMQLIIECFDNVQTSVFFAKSGGKINIHL